MCFPAFIRRAHVGSSVPYLRLTPSHPTLAFPSCTVCLCCKGHPWATEGVRITLCICSGKAAAAGAAPVSVTTGTVLGTEPPCFMHSSEGV